VYSILEEAVNSVDPYRLVDQNIVLTNGTLIIGDRKYPAQKFIILVAMGKASVSMTQAAVDKLGDRIKRGVCVCKALPEHLPDWKNVELCQGAHPMPDERSQQAAVKIRKVLEGVSSEDLVLVLVSGGSSALVVDPRGGISLADLRTMNQELLRCGATINEINCVRKHVERLKGGGLAKLAQPAQIEALLLSDVIGDDMSVIASGPTVPDKTTFADARAIVDKYQLEKNLPASILGYLQKGMEGSVEETLKPAEAVNQRVNNDLIGSNRYAIDAAMAKARQLGISCECLSEAMIGEADEASKWFLKSSLERAAASPHPFMAIAGGETTVTIKGDGKGGRNLQVALAAVKAMAGQKNAVLVTLATDGEDGPTDAAGAIVMADTYERAQALGLDPDESLARNDAYTFFERVGGLIKTGSTGTNVNDLTFFFQF
jgi:hydroxypyruvate reductase